ncbi:2-C-methyl-D-erythritol 4-phosphate cytidylyltransferase [Amylibacter ulvae]|uniref:2-C-methyl-D-erythritol 4-phosphate cytidylyltransferase n=1 Tax=Paramylibacter ulvae TaxID=1651968 RepID=A0ABQ3CU05_9RHOB|nr:2-C-methyl-D-erythritol 4-phosphate cytidylyltransferase [Amylibacter ulvae]GHA41421.1 2-C-methyl-D-erythritol 4-phosphate cytidylyltransferase [Amylibacter ulvae]
MSIAALIVAAGRGTRAGGETPKQYHALGDRTVIYHTITNLLANTDIREIWVAIHRDDLELFTEATRNIDDARFMGHIIGGTTRSDTVRIGLESITCEYVLIHDGARPLLPIDALSRVIDQMLISGAAFCALPITDAIWAVSDGRAQSAQPRDTFWRAQTPQAFNTAEILAAHRATDKPADDDVAIARRAGIDVTVVLGSERNIKITHAGDFALAEKLLRE